MPEGDTVLRTARRLDAALAGRVLRSTDLRWPTLAAADLSGQVVREVVARGKHLLARTDAGATLHSHLRMDGSWHVQRTPPPGGAGAGRTPRLRGGSAEGVRAVLVTDDWTAVGHRLGMLDLVATAEEDGLVGHLGPDLLADDWDTGDGCTDGGGTDGGGTDGAGAAVAALVADGDREVGAALLDQRLVAGIGTFWMSETLFLRGVSPWAAVRDVPDLAGLLARTRRMMRAAADAREPVQTTTGDTRPGRNRYVHARSGLPCLRCGTTVRVAPLGSGPTARSAFSCPVCQPGPRPTDDGRPQAPLGHDRRGGAPARRRGTSPRA
ncbi:DNA-formamidopyrimidine glycosylase family protein [uncultured Pseudokineococcus sp.]|uniref:DNA-formamidopyrimidine glycosylase family protein n=1 Tax=uncultured Pseudokineococcus sp. TaxID=1642928 RepID=UPI0026033206|nr:DNA-formamidopyrimidine glycosylase family protein [uncultured Pseudokineococcus sp.]